MDAKAPQVESSPTTKPRLISLDLLRGLTVIGMILVNEMAGMQSEGAVYPTLLHERWEGLHLADVVFPAFLLMVGISIPLSMRGSHPNPQDEYKHILWRSVRLIVLGWLLSNMWWFMHFNQSSWRLFGVLQRIGIVYAVCSLMFMWVKPRTQLIVAATILILYWPLTLIPSLDGLPNDIWARGHNFVGSVDRVLLGAGHHNYLQGPDGYDPEGLLGTLPAIAQGLIGVAIGEYLLRGADRDRLRKLAYAGAAMLVFGIAWGFVFPVVKDIWSSTFVLVTSGIATLVLVGLSLLFDGKPLKGPRYVAGALILPFGVNAIAAYVLHEVAGGMLAWDLLQKPYRAIRPIVGTELAAFVPVGLFIAFVWLCMFYLWRKKWLIRI
jgi:predicted acyltransferase